MKIGFDGSDLCTDRADGTTRYAKEMAKRLPGLLSGHEFMTFAPCAPTPSLRQGFGRQASSSQWYFSPWPKYWTQTRLPVDLFRYKPDVMFMPIQQIPYIRPGKMKTVAVMHDLAVHTYPEQFTYKDWMLLHWFSAYMARQADQVIAVSQSTADDMAKYYGRRENVHVVHHGVDHEQFRLPSETERSEARENLTKKYPQLNKPFILYVGQLQPRKNIIRLVEAFEGMEDKELQLVIVGGHGWLKKPILDRIEKSKVRDRIHLLGRVPDELLASLYWQAEVYVLPSLYEGFGIPLLEAMASGCPVVAANNSSIPEVVGDAAVLIDPHNVASIRDGINEARGRRDELQAKGIKRAAEFNWDRTAKATADIILSA